MKAADKELLKDLLSTFDENGLIALANKGLLRRAQKDLEAATLQLEEADDCFIIRGPDWTVWMPAAGPAKAKDDTPASGITRQILSATIFLRDHLLSSPGSTLRPQPLIRDSHQESPEAASPPLGVLTAFQAAPKEALSAEATPTESIPLEAAPLESETSDVPFSASVVEAIEATWKVALPGVAEPKAFYDSNPTAKKLKDAILNISSDDLAKWCGKTLYREILAQERMEIQEEIMKTGGLILRFPLQDIEVRISPSKESSAQKLLDSVMTTAPKALHKRWVLTAILELQRDTGKDLGLQQQKSVADIANQAAVLAHCKDLLESILANGLAHPSSRIIERFFTLSVSAASFQLPRLAYLLRTLSQEVEYIQNREAVADTQRMFDQMSWAFALAKALESNSVQSVELAGVARTQYDPAGDLKLSGVGAYPWQTDSGYEGLTVLLWESEKERFLSWSVSRPSTQTLGFNVNQLYNSESPWQGSGTANQVSRTSILLKNSKCNPVGRLSSSQSSSVDGKPDPCKPMKMEFGKKLFKEWSSLRQYAAVQFPCGLRLHNPLDRIVVLEPHTWGERFYDEMQQSLCWQLIDEQHQLLLLTLPWNKNNESAIEFLESVKPERDGIKAVLARIVFSNAGYIIEPISLFSSGTPKGDFVLNPSFDHHLIVTRQSTLLDRLRQKYGTDRIPTAMISEDDWSEMIKSHELSDNAPPIVRNCLADLERVLLYFAESGTRNMQESLRTEAKLLSDKLSRAGLIILAQSLSTICNEGKPQASSLLWANYILKIHWQSLAKQPLLEYA